MGSDRQGVEVRNRHVTLIGGNRGTVTIELDSVDVEAEVAGLYRIGEVETVGLEVFPGGVAFLFAQTGSLDAEFQERHLPLCAGCDISDSDRVGQRHLQVKLLTYTIEFAGCLGCTKLFDLNNRNLGG